MKLRADDTLMKRFASGSPQSGEKTTGSWPGATQTWRKERSVRLSIQEVPPKVSKSYRTETGRLLRQKYWAMMMMTESKKQFSLQHTYRENCDEATLLKRSESTRREVSFEFLSSAH
jgi:hypothetical protein